MMDKRYIRFNEYEFPETAKIEADGIALQSYRYPAANAKARLIFMHGLNDYAGRYAFLGQMFAQENIDFVCIDQRGHGRSDGQRGHFESISQLANEQAKLLESYSDLPVFLVGDQAGALNS